MEQRTFPVNQLCSHWQWGAPQKPQVLLAPCRTKDGSKWLFRLALEAKRAAAWINRRQPHSLSDSKVIFCRDRGKKCGSNSYGGARRSAHVAGGLRALPRQLSGEQEHARACAAAAAAAAAAAGGRSCGESFGARGKLMRTLATRARSSGRTPDHRKSMKMLALLISALCCEFHTLLQGNESGAPFKAEIRPPDLRLDWKKSLSLNSAVLIPTDANVVLFFEIPKNAQ